MHRSYDKWLYVQGNSIGIATVEIGILLELSLWCVMESKWRGEGMWEVVRPVPAENGYCRSWKVLCTALCLTDLIVGSWSNTLMPFIAVSASRWILSRIPLKSTCDIRRSRNCGEWVYPRLNLPKRVAVNKERYVLISFQFWLSFRQ